FSFFGAVIVGPAVAQDFAGAGDGERVAGDGSRDGAAGRDVSAVADGQRGDEGGIGADEDAAAYTRVLLVEAVVIGDDRAGADVGFFADHGVAEIRDMFGFRTGLDGGAVDLDEVADGGALADLGFRADAGEGAD